MKRIIYVSFSVVMLLLLVSCKDNSISFGTVGYYPAFLWVDSSVTPVTKTFDFDFSNDAKDDKNSFAEFQFVDNDGKPISADVLHVTIDNETIKDNKFRIYSDVESKQIVFSFSPEAESGKYQGYLKLVNHNLDRLESQELTPGQTFDVFQWTLHYKKVMNPLAEFLMWFFIVVLSCAIVWLVLLKRIFFPVIKLACVKLTGDNVAYMNTKNINRCRKVVFTNKAKKQGFFNKLFCGKILYVVNDVWTSDWEMCPGSRRRTVIFRLHGIYTLNPMKGCYTSQDKCVITNINSKTRINIQIS